MLAAENKRDTSFIWNADYAQPTRAIHFDVDVVVVCVRVVSTLHSDFSAEHRVTKRTFHLADSILAIDLVIGFIHRHRFLSKNFVQVKWMMAEEAKFSIFTPRNAPCPDNVCCVAPNHVTLPVTA